MDDVPVVCTVNSPTIQKLHIHYIKVTIAKKMKKYFSINGKVTFKNITQNV